ncbi:MAG: NosD domain-containing protein [Candidatus Heimdallarchaeaceae archaeon]
MNNKFKNAILLLILLSTTSLIFSNFESSFGLKVKLLENHTAIEIASDSDFSSLGFLGSGTESDPYIIEGYNITTTSTYGIYIHGSTVTAYFIISDCYIDAVSRGIYITGIANGIAVIENNTIVNNDEAGIYIDQTDNVNITDNTVLKNGKGIYLNYASYTLIDNNTCVSNTYSGIYVYTSSNYADITHNNCSYNEKGIYLQGSDGKVLNNTISYNDKNGIEFYYNAVRYVIANNTFESNQNYAISLTGTANNDIEISNNTLTNDGFFISPANDYANTISIEDNKINGKGVGYFVKQTSETITGDYSQIILINCSTIIIELNSFSQADTAIYMKDCTDCVVRKNTFVNNEINAIMINDDIDVQFSGNIIIENNTISGSNIAAQLGGVKEIIVNENVVEDCDKGFYINYEEQVNVSIFFGYNQFNNVIENAISVEKVVTNENIKDDLKIVGNQFTDITGAAIYLVCIENITIRYNSIEKVNTAIFIYGIYSSYTVSTALDISNNSIDTANYAFHLITFDSKTQTIIENNTIKNTATSISTSNIADVKISANVMSGTLEFDYSEKIEVINNELNDGGVVVSSSENVNISNNKMNSGNKAIKIFESANVTIKGNTISNYDSHAIDIYAIQGLNVIENEISNVAIGLELYADTARLLENIEVIGNSFVQVEKGIYSNSGHEIENITIKDNTIITLKELKTYGIYFMNSGGTNLEISDNNIMANEDCIWLYGIWTNAVIENNRMSGYSVDIRSRIIYLQGLDGATITNNTFINARDEDSLTYIGLMIYLGPSTTNTLVYNNYFLSLDAIINDVEIAMDDGTNNVWYNEASKTGNYWSNYNGSGTYGIEGSAGAIDLYPITFPDTDGDGLDDYIEEMIVGTDPNDEDSDDDGMPDGWELFNGLNPISKDGDGDLDDDGLNNVDEYTNNTDPNDEDSDNDGMSDGWEVENKLNPLVNDANEDSDNDGLTNIEEYWIGTDPNNVDTDGDGFTDKEERDEGTDPLNPNSHPEEPTTEKSPFLFFFGIMGIVTAVLFHNKRNKK